MPKREQIRLLEAIAKKEQIVSRVASSLKNRGHGFPDNDRLYAPMPPHIVRDGSISYSQSSSFDTVLRVTVAGGSDRVLKNVGLDSLREHALLARGYREDMQRELNAEKNP